MLEDLTFSPQRAYTQEALSAKYTSNNQYISKTMHVSAHFILFPFLRTYASTRRYILTHISQYKYLCIHPQSTQSHMYMCRYDTVILHMKHFRYTEGILSKTWCFPFVANSKPICRVDKIPGGHAQVVPEGWRRNCP